MKKLTAIFLVSCMGCTPYMQTSDLEWNSAINGNTLFLAYINEPPVFYDSLKLDYKSSFEFYKYKGCKWAVIPVRIVDEKATIRESKNTFLYNLSGVKDSVLYFQNIKYIIVPFWQNSFIDFINYKFEQKQLVYFSNPFPVYRDNPKSIFPDTMYSFRCLSENLKYSNQLVKCPPSNIITITIPPR
jgi:hypothetical protein